MMSMFSKVSPNKKLQTAVQSNDHITTTTALNDGANPNTFMRHGLYKRVPVLIVAAGEGFGDVVAALLSGAANTELTVDYWGTPLHAAASKGHSGIVQQLLHNGAQVNAKDSIDGDLPIHWAAHWGHAKVAEILVQHGADLTATDGLGRTAAEAAELRGHRDLSAYLRSAARDPGDAMGHLSIHDPGDDGVIYAGPDPAHTQDISYAGLAQAHTQDISQGVTTAYSGYSTTADIYHRSPGYSGNIDNDAAISASASAAADEDVQDQSHGASGYTGGAPMSPRSHGDPASAIVALLDQHFQGNQAAYPHLQEIEKDGLFMKAVDESDVACVTNLLKYAEQFEADTLVDALEIAEEKKNRTIIRLIKKNMKKIEEKKGGVDYTDPTTSAAAAIQKLSCREPSYGDSANTVDLRGFGCYKNNRGRILLFNYVKFLDQRKNRTGATEDNDTVKNAFATFSNKYDVIVYDSLTTQETLTVFANLQQDVSLTDVDSLIVFISSHGKSRDEFYTHDGEIDIDHLRSLLFETPDGCPYLMGKPKIFLANYCQGTGLEIPQSNAAVEESSMLTVSEEGKKTKKMIAVARNIKTFYSASSGVVAWRKKDGGSYFLQSFCEVLTTHQGLELNQIICTANDQVEKELGCNTTFSSEGSRFKHFYF